MSILRWEMWGIFFIILLGALLHFTFEFSGSWRPLGIVSAVNESVWEHLKLAFWPAIFGAVVEFFLIKTKVGEKRHNFIFAKSIGAYIMSLVIVVIFYSYTAFTGDSILAVDLSSFVIAVVIGQIASYKLWHSLKPAKALSWLGITMIIVGVLFFAIFTFYPPNFGIFQDPVTGGYGIVH